MVKDAFTLFLNDVKKIIRDERRAMPVFINNRRRFGRPDGITEAEFERNLRSEAVVKALKSFKFRVLNLLKEVGYP